MGPWLIHTIICFSLGEYLMTNETFTQVVTHPVAGMLTFSSQTSGSLTDTSWCAGTAPPSWGWCSPSTWLVSGWPPVTPPSGTGHSTTECCPVWEWGWVRGPLLRRPVCPPPPPLQHMVIKPDKIIRVGPSTSSYSILNSKSQIMTRDTDGGVTVYNVLKAFKPADLGNVDFEQAVEERQQTLFVSNFGTLHLWHFSPLPLFTFGTLHLKYFATFFFSFWIKPGMLDTLQMAKNKIIIVEMICLSCEEGHRDYCLSSRI